MENKLTFGRLFWILVIPAFTTGMGNGSVFGAAMMCALGRQPFGSWGGWPQDNLDPTSFNGFMTWQMLIFGFAFSVIVMIGCHKHGQREAKGGDATW